MIKRAGNDDKIRIVDYLMREGSINTVFLANIERYGFDKDFQDIWFYYDESSIEPQAVIMRHFNSLYIYGGGSFNEEYELGSFANFIGSEIISGKSELINKIGLELGDMTRESSIHMKLENTYFLSAYDLVERAKLDDCYELSSIIFSVPEFARFYHSRMEIEKGIRRRMEMGFCRYFIIRHKGRIVSQAYTTMESSQFATVSGVVTLPEYRKKGLASQVVSGISIDIINDGKVPNLFYNNVEAGRVYKRLGYNPAGDYTTLTRKY